MEFSFNTENRAAGVGLQALQHYKAGQFKDAITCFTEILDMEPGNWDARLLLAASYYKSGQYMSAERIFHYISNTCNDMEIRSKATQALRSTKSQIERGTTELPAEFGCYNAPGVNYCSSWLDG